MVKVDENQTAKLDSEPGKKPEDLKAQAQETVENIGYSWAYYFFLRDDVNSIQS